MLTTTIRDRYVWLAVGLALLVPPAYMIALLRWRLASVVAAMSAPALLLITPRSRGRR